MDNFERLIGSQPPKQFLIKSRARLDALWKSRFAQQNARDKEQRLLSEASFGVIRRLAGEDPKLAASAKRIRAQAVAHGKKKLTLPDRPPRVPSRVRLGSISATFVPTFWGKWFSDGQQGDGWLGGGINVNPSTGNISLNVSAGLGGGGSAWEAAALGGYFQPPASNGILDIFANPSMGYDFQTWYFLASANAGGFIGLYVGEYTLQGQFQAALVDQQINISSLGGSSSLPLAASIWVDSDHFYEIWVWAGVNVSADGFHTFWDSSASAQLSVWVPAISIYYF